MNEVALKDGRRADVDLDLDLDLVARYLQAHRIAVHPRLDRVAWRDGYRLALHEFPLTRLQLYLIAHTDYEYTFLPAVMRTASRLWEL